MRLRAVVVAVSLVASLMLGTTGFLAEAAPQQQTVVVTSTGDAGPGTLREALERATAGTRIIFDPAVFPPDDPATIAVISGLPELTRGQVTIDASNAGVILDGSQLPGGEPTYGLLIASDGNVIRGMQILGFPGDGISIVRGARNNTIGGDRTVGIGPTGQGNVISGNRVSGITLGDVGTVDNVVTGNYVGTDPTGTLAWGNGAHGIAIQRSESNTVGGTAPGERNVISGNGSAGVRIEYVESGGNVVIGNYIGTDATGARALAGNAEGGVVIAQGALNNRIGGAGEEERNIISGNDGDGIRIDGSGTSHNLVMGNFVGLDVSGTQPLPNSHGVSLWNGASHNRVHGNVVSGHQQNPNVVLWDPGTSFNFIIGNMIGTDASGTVAVPSAGGVAIRGGASDNRIGGPTQGEGNLISGNSGTGIDISSGSARNEVLGNLIGTDISGTFAIPNGMGILIEDGAENIVGGGADGDRNIVSGNELDAVVISRAGSTANMILGNYIGTDLSGTAAIGNGVDGVWIGEGAHNNVVGGVNQADRNVISGNGNNGVVIDNSDHNTVIGNYIGTDASGTVALGNSNIGVVLAWGAQYNLVGGARPEERNLISGNGNVGVSIANRDTMSNTISGNHIGTDLTGTVAIGNAGIGVHLNDGAQHNVIGGIAPEEANLISGNGINGVNIGGSDTKWNVVSGNHIGPTSRGTMGLGNEGDGVHIDTGARLNIVGPGNIIAYNGENGVSVQGGNALGNTITANSIYGNGDSGIQTWEGGNAELPPPILAYVGRRTIRGAGPPNSRVEIFFDQEDATRIFQGSTNSDEQGGFTFNVPVGASAVVKVAATATDGEGNTSQFSDPESPRAPVVTRELPGLVGPTQVSTEPKVVGTNLGLALFCVFFFGVTSTVFNSILRDFRGELQGSLRRLIPRVLEGLLGMAGSSVRSVGERGWGALLSMWLAVLLVTSLIESFLDPGIHLLGPERLGILVTLFVSAVVVGGLELGSALVVRRRLAPTVRAVGQVQWLGIAVAIACVVVSRALDFKPGYLYGIVGALYLMPEVVGVANSGKRAVFVLAAVLSGSFLLWIASAFLPAGLVELEPLLLTTFLIGLQGAFFGLLPFTFTDGGDIWNWRKGVWLGFFFVVFFSFYHVVLNPGASDVQALQQNGVQTVLVLIAMFGLSTVVLWLLFPFRLRGRAN